MPRRRLLLLLVMGLSSPLSPLLQTAPAVAAADAPDARDAPADGDNSAKALLAVRTATPPVIDGRLEDLVWQGAPPDDRLRQLFPDDGKPPSERTEIRVLYDDAAVYVAVRAFDRDPGAINARLTRRDRQVEADAIGIGFDSRHDHSTAFVFVVNAGGVQSDLLVFNDSNVNEEWDAVWDVAVSRDDGGWNAEFRIPLQVLRFTAADVQEWGFNVRRHISRRKEDADWAYIPQDVNAFVSRWGHLQGLKGLKPKRSLELRPFGVARVGTRTPEGGALFGVERGAEQDPAIDLGLDVKYGITSNLTLDATVNPDFGQVEADQVVLNLSRFESFFPEKRPFFLEGTDIFRTPLQVFYSRRIGRPPSALSAGAGVRTGDGRVLEVTRAPASLRIWSALKLSGKVGERFTVGVLDALTGPEEVVARGEDRVMEDVRRSPVRNFAVVRGKYAFRGASYLGFLATGVNRVDGELARAAANHDAYVQSLDGNYVSASGRLSASAQVAVSERVGGPSLVGSGGLACPEPQGATACTPIVRANGTRQRPGDVGFGGQLRANYQGDHWGTNLFAESYSPKLDLNDLGFLNQSNHNFINVGGGWRDLKPHGVFQNRYAGFGARTGMTYDGVRTNLGGGFEVGGQFKNFMFANVNVGTSVPTNWDPYETGDGAYFARVPGAHLNVYFESDSRKRVTVSSNAGGYLDYDGVAWGAWAGADAAMNLMSQLEVNFGAKVGWDANNVRNWFFGGCVDAAGDDCTVDTLSRTYRFAQLDAGSLSFTVRGTYTFTPRLSLQGYAQLFMDQGEFHDRQVTETTGARPFIDRGDLRDDPGNDGDMDGDGKADDTFQDTSLNLNVVLRWELIPGTTLLGVYTRSSDAAYDLAGARPRFRITGLSTGPTEEIFLIKLVYYWT